jgi:hypothetical protein
VAESQQQQQQQQQQQRWGHHLEPLAVAFDLCRASHVLQLVHTAVREAAAANTAWVDAANSRANHSSRSSSRCADARRTAAGGTLCATGNACHTTVGTSTTGAQECCLELPGWAQQLPATVAAAQRAVAKLLQLR